MSEIVDEKMWVDYTQRNEDAFRCVGLINQIVKDLNCKSILEVGCNVGNNLMYFRGLDVHGIDSSHYAINLAEKKYPFVKFHCGQAQNLPYTKDSFDMVFTRGMIIHIPPIERDRIRDELFRVSNRYIMNIEYYNNLEIAVNWREYGDKYLWYCNMSKRWKNSKVKILQDYQIPLEIDQDNVRLTLVEKM